MQQVLQKAGKKPGDIIVGGIDLGPATIDGLKSGYITATLDQLLYLQGFMPVVQCVMTAKYKMPGLSLNTGAGTVTPQTIDTLTKLIDAGIRLRELVALSRRIRSTADAEKASAAERSDVSAELYPRPRVAIRHEPFSLSAGRLVMLNGMTPTEPRPMGRERECSR